MSTTQKREALAKVFQYLNKHPQSSYRAAAPMFSQNMTTIINNYQNPTKEAQISHQNHQRCTTEERIKLWIGVTILP